MKHTSIKLDSPIEVIETTAISPLISKCSIKVCYVGDEPNRNRSIITKEVARKMAPSLRGCPIVGFYNDHIEDYEEHNVIIKVANNKCEINDATVPYGFVDINAKIWFEKFLDDNKNEHEYLCTEGYIWNHVYPDCQRILDKGNNQSMELDEKTLDAFWSKDENGYPEFFIINEALISKLCILGEENEPCFEGSQITAVQFSFEDNFKTKLFSMMEELKELIKEGGTKVFTTYAVEIGDTLWSALYRYIETTWPDGENRWCSKYTIDGIFEDAGQKFVILQSRDDMKYYRLNFSISESDGLIVEDGLTEVTKTYTPAAEPQFAAEAVEAFIEEYKKQKEQDENQQSDNNKTEDVIDEDKTDYTDDEEKCPKCGKPISECTCEEEKKKYSLDEIPEYIDLQNQYSALEAQIVTLNATIESLNNELAPLRQFKLSAERHEKEAMIARFYMLSDEDKADVINNIDTYSLDDIEAKLSIICVRNRVSFAEPEEKDSLNGVTFNLAADEEDNTTPAWVRAALNVAKTMDNN